MEPCVDFLNRLDPDLLLKILMCLFDPSDLVRVSCVSRSWRHYVIANGLCKQLCLRMFPQLSKGTLVVELNKDGVKEPTAEVGSSYSMEWQALERDHRVYSFLARASTSFVSGDCITETIAASSTDHFPDESIVNTLEPRHRVAGRTSYWSSIGKSNPDVPETLIYKLVSQICVITEINICPFQAFFEYGLPIYSAKSVRFKMGHPKASVDALADQKFVWTYTSPEFPMAQESRLQKFKLPEPVLCIGGILQIELLGRVQREEIDDLFYICVTHVQAVGCSLSPAFSVEILEPSGIFVLKRDLLSKFQSHTQQIVPRLQEIVLGVVEDDWDEDDEFNVFDEDDEFDEFQEYVL